MSRVTIVDVRAMLKRAAGAAASVGIDSAHWWIQQGSPSNGQAWRLFSTPPGTSGAGTAVHGLDRGYLGWSAREAYDTLHTLAVAWEAVADRNG